MALSELNRSVTKPMKWIYLGLFLLSAAALTVGRLAELELPSEMKKNLWIGSGLSLLAFVSIHLSYLEPKRKSRR